MVDVYHELAYPYEVMASVLKALKPGGRVVFVEYKAEDPPRAHQAAAQDERGADQARGRCLPAGVGTHCEHAALAACGRVPKTGLTTRAAGGADDEFAPSRFQGARSINQF